MTPQEFIKNEAEKIVIRDDLTFSAAKGNLLAQLKDARSKKGKVVLSVDSYERKRWGDQAIRKVADHLRSLGWCVKVRTKFSMDECPFARKMILILTTKEAEPQYSLQPKSKWPYWISGMIGGMTGNWLALHFQQQILHFLHLTK